MSNNVSKRQAINGLLDNRASRLKEASQENSNTEIQEDDRKKKKATFELDLELHKELKIFATNQNAKMVDIVEKAIKVYIQQNSNTGIQE